MSIYRKKYITGTIVLFLALLSGVVYVNWNNFKDSETVPQYLQGMGGDFVLQSANGPVSLQDFRGKVILLFFGYTNCPDICPLTLTNWAIAFENLTDREMADVRGLFVSVDPGRDTAEVLKNYTEYFSPYITGVTGTHEKLKKITAMYRSEYELENDGKGKDYLVDHMSFVYVIDRQGKVHDLLTSDSTPEDITRSVRKFL